MSIQQLEALLAAAEGGPDFGDPPEKARADFAAMLQSLPVPDSVSVEERELGGVSAIRVTPEGAEFSSGVMYVHGGAYIAGSARDYLSVVAALAVSLQMPVYAIDYRLAPEAVFPAAIDDARSAFLALAQEMGAKNVAVVGDSAGGGLSLSLLAHLKDRGELLPAVTVLLSPWTDLSCSGGSIETKAAEDPILTAEGLRNAARIYLDGADPRDPAASPLCADLSGLPPVHVHVGSREILLDDALRLADHGDVDVRVWQGMVHDWCMFWFALDEAQEVLDVVSDQIRRAVSVVAK
ncbi:alpha/beta hydrolase [Corynebacterium nasicanis]|uniref:Alpha/beta hydrolase n=1 Tax=Corynebacterium nasicanis TaxID=1448267 RepID=A0ABW1QA35_9CORY